MKQIFFILQLVFISARSFSQVAVLPQEYRQIKEVFGDLDKDGIEERVAVYNVSEKADDVNGVDREVIVYKKMKGAWAIWHRSLTAVGNSKEGGMMGDPFEDIEIKNGLLLISQSGGSSWKWRYTDTYRYQNKRFELIGYNSYYGKLCEYWLAVDYNLSTGKILMKKEYESCDAQGSQTVYKTEKENFFYKPSQKIVFSNRKPSELKIVTPKYKEELYL